MLSTEEKQSNNRMSDSKMKSFLPLYPTPPSDDEAKKSPVPTKDKVVMVASQIAHSTGPSSNISPVPTPKSIKTRYGQLTPAPGRLTPTGQGRIKAAPVCMATSMKKVASSMDVLDTTEVCFSPKEAEGCADKALSLDEKVGINYTHLEDMPLNIGKCDAGLSLKNLADSSSAGEGKAYVSSSSTVVTTSTTGSCGRGNEIAAMSAGKKGPPLEVIRTDLAANSEDEHHDSAVVAHGALGHVAKTPMASKISSSALSSTFTNNLIKGKSSRQGRSLQRYLVHSPTEELVRQVAGTIPITRDGRIILVSASRKSEWILPKGGWDADETKEECAARETFEEAGLLGRLGGCLEPIDYETSKAKKRRLSMLESGESKGKTKTVGGERKDEGMHPPQPKRAKTDNGTTSTSSTGPAHPPSMPSATKPPKSHSYIRLFLFPLYVSTVKADWPENGRLRKLVDIDEAIKIMELENRQYFKRGLEMVKERGLHLLKPEGSPKEEEAKPVKLATTH
ncbi:hypothetical protein ACHAXR_005878 [Thalassiosira sp. AJA248-18]